ncbi:IS3 family transposase [Candidatus Uabimicrobium sp. HlEnr_7]|uniref:IS3 family transposase n=1 Tax=Candidatus Uabimicrobium helgolandensis TaxID=3095367 RepID=UPI0035560A14
MSSKHRLELVDKNDSEYSVRKQCEILDVRRGNLYYKRKCNKVELDLAEKIRWVGEKHPFYGYRKTAEILKRLGNHVGYRKVRRLKKQLGIKTLYPKPRLSVPRKDHKKYPYLLKDLDINYSDMVWATDITFIRIKNKGWVYLTAVIDWHSRYVISHQISTTMDQDFCIQALQDALDTKHKPCIFNTDQGSQFTSNEFTKVLKNNGIKISMDGKGRCLDNVIIERFWRSLKYEEVFLNEYHTVEQAKLAIREYIQFYNNERIHQSLDYATPREIYFRFYNKKIAS